MKSLTIRSAEAYEIHTRLKKIENRNWRASVSWMRHSIVIIAKREKSRKVRYPLERHMRGHIIGLAKLNHVRNATDCENLPGFNSSYKYHYYIEDYIPLNKFIEYKGKQKQSRKITDLKVKEELLRLGRK